MVKIPKYAGVVLVWVSRPDNLFAGTVSVIVSVVVFVSALCFYFLACCAHATENTGIMGNDTAGLNGKITRPLLVTVSIETETQFCLF